MKKKILSIVLMLSVIASISIPSVDASAKAKNIKCSGVYMKGKYKVAFEIYGGMYNAEPGDECGEITVSYKNKVIWQDQVLKIKTNTYMYNPTNGMYIKVKVQKKKIQVKYSPKYKKSGFKVKNGTYKLKIKWDE